MSDTTTNAQAQPSMPQPDLQRLDRLVGTWNVSGGAQGQVTYEWIEGNFSCCNTSPSMGRRVSKLLVISSPSAQRQVLTSIRATMTSQAIRSTMYMNLTEIPSQSGAVQRGHQPIMKARLVPTATR